MDLGINNDVAGVVRASSAAALGGRIQRQDNRWHNKYMLWMSFKFLHQ